MANKAKRRTPRQQAEQFVSELCDGWANLEWHKADFILTFIAGYRAARADARREQKRKEKA